MAHCFSEEDVEGLYAGLSLGLGLGLGCNESVRGFEEEDRVPAREEDCGDRHGASRLRKPIWKARVYITIFQFN